MKRIIVMLLTAVLLFSLFGCGKKNVDVVVNTEGMTDLQKAVVITAESFYLRGNRAQYDMNSMTKVDLGDVSRRLVGVKAPEDYTVQQVGYTDCSGFVYDVYKSALDFKITGGQAWTKAYADSAPNRVLKVFPKPDAWNEEELKAKEKEFRDTLQPGDIIVYRYAGNTSGHAMLYVGNGMIIHSTGSSYNFNKKTEVFEEEGTYLYESIDKFFNAPNARSYLFSKHVYVILRPLDAFEGEITASTQTRMTTMRGIVAEKFSSHSVGQTVNKGDEVTFTYRITNKSDVKRTVTVTDIVPENTEFVSGPSSVVEDALAWTVSIPAGGEKTVSYTVKVTGEAGAVVKGNGAVDAIVTECPAVVIGNTLTADEQKAITTQASVPSELTGLSRINAIYTAAVGKPAIANVTEEALKETLFEYWGMDWALNREGELFGMVAPHLYGGRKVAEQTPDNMDAQQRTRLITKENLVVGDVLYVDDELYVFLGESLLNVTTNQSATMDFLESIIAYDTFAVLRPSLV